MILAHRLALDPTVTQAQQLARAAGVARFAFNWGLAEWQRQYAAGEKPSAYALKKRFNAVKRSAFPWASEVTKCAAESAFENLRTAFTNFFRRVKAGRPPGYPKFKKRGVHDAFGVANDKFRLEGRRVNLPKIGWVRTREALRFAGKILGGTVSSEAGRWFLSVQVDCGDIEAVPHGGPVVGVDLGLKTFAMIHDGERGEKIEAPKPLRANLRRLARAQRVQARRKPGSHRRAKARRRVARLHARVRNIRQDFLHKLTTRLAKTTRAVCVEDLCVRGMARRWGRAIADIGFFEFRRQLEYKARLHGSCCVVVDRFFPSSKTCAACGAIREALALSERVFRCEACGAVADRDANAALNLRTLGLRETGRCEPANARGPEGAGARVRPRVKPCRVEPRTTPRGHSRAFTK